jgi:hypothetical protein
LEDIRLIEHFAHWLSKVSERQVSADTFETDLMDGVALCKVMVKIPGSGLVRFHEIQGSTAPLEAFKARENIQAFGMAAKQLNLPVTFGTEELEKGNLGRIASTLVFLAHCAHAHGVLVQDMDQEILDKVEEMDAALIKATENIETKSDDSIDAQAQASLSWWRNLLIKFGLGDWISFLNVDSLKAYLATIKANAEQRIEEQKQQLQQKIDEQKQLVRQASETFQGKIEERKQLVRQASETFQGKLLEHTSSWKDSLPESVRSRLL